MFKKENQPMIQWNNPPPTFLSNRSSLSNSTCFTYPTLWESTFPSSNHLLLQYRKNKPNLHLDFQPQSQDFLSKFLCKIFAFNDQQQTPKPFLPSKCKCERREDGTCPLIMKWIEEHYYWKTDKQFIKAYEHYNRKKSSQCLEQLIVKLQNIVCILGIKIEPIQLESIAKVVANYIKHTVYYSKSQKLIRQSEIYLWIALGITYHVGIQEGKNNEEIIFWALDLAMNAFEDLSKQSCAQHCEKIMQYLGYYFPKWVNFLINEKNINLKEIIREWINEMMFGYMGIESIAFFVDCSLKKGWNYLYKIILSYFEHRVEAIGRDELFLSGQAKTQDIVRMLLDGQEEWPMIFCSAVTFNFEEKVKI